MQACTQRLQQSMQWWMWWMKVRLYLSRTLVVPHVVPMHSCSANGH